MKNSKLRRALMLAACAVLLVCLSVGATLAYLTDDETVTNTFTVGKVVIKLDEGDVYDEDDGEAFTAENNGKFEDEGKTRVTTNKYKLVPGREYDKDPTITIDATSEACYVYVQIKNDIADIEAADIVDETTDKITTAVKIESQMLENHGWQKLTDKNGNVIEGFYYQEAPKTAADGKIIVFETFTVKGDGIDNTTLDSYKGKTIVVKAYAIQKDGFDNAIDAWDAANGEMEKIGE